MYTLLKKEDKDFCKTSAKILWIEFDEEGLYLQSHKEPKEGLTLLMSPFNHLFTWQTADITKLHSATEHEVVFDTKNSKYKLIKTEL